MRRLLTFAFLLALPLALAAQFDVATLAGTVSDPSGSVIPQVAVVATNQATNVAVTTQTNESGRFLFPSLRPGVYKITATAQGFKQFVSTGVILQVNQSGRFDIDMQVGAVSEQVTVAGEAKLLETESSSRGAVLDQRKIIELPLNGRDYNQLALLSPGVLAPTPRLQSIGFRGAFNVNGNRAFQNAFQLDGVDNTSYSNSFRGMNVQVIQPGIEALQEFKIQTNAYGAEFGRSSGALINAVIRSGGNQLHGSLFEFHRNDNFDANNFFANRTGQKKPFRLRNQYGGSLGGPIKRDKTFFFGDYEGQYDRAGTVRLSSVPQPMWRQGRFAVPIFNPFNAADTGTDFRIPAQPGCNNGGFCWQIPANLIDPVGQRVINVSPDPNVATTGIDNNYVGVPVDQTHSEQFDLRGDHNFSQNFSIFGRYSFADSVLFRPAPRPGLSEGSFNDTFGSADLRSQALAVGATWVISPAMVSESRFGYTRGQFFQLPPNFGSGCPQALIGLAGSVTNEALCGGLPVMNFPGGNLRRIGRTTSVPQFQTPRGYNFRQSFSRTRGAHNLKFGGEYLRVSTGVRDVGSLLGNFSFSGRFTGANNTTWENGLADMLLGFPTRYQQDSDTTFNLFQNMYFFYLQDDWKVNKKLTVNVGLRYEYANPVRERDNLFANFDPGTRAFVQAAGGDMFARARVYPDRNNYAPRVGFSYSPFARTVVRGAYGIFYNHTTRSGREGLLGFNPPFIILGDLNIGGSNILKSTNALMKLSTGIPAGVVSQNPATLPTLGRKSQDSFQRTSYVQQYNVGIQQELARDVVLDVAWVANRGLKLTAFRNLNANLYTFNAAGVAQVGLRALAGANLTGDIQHLENLGISNYHSLQTKIERRFSQGFTLLAAYTWGKAMTDSVDHLSTSGAGNGVDVGAFREPQNPAHRRSDYGLSEFDVKHRLVVYGVFQLPFGRNKTYGKNWSRGVDLLIGGWEFSPIFTWQGGLGLTVLQNQAINIGGERRSRPNRLANGTLSDGQRTVDRWFDTAAFVALTATTPNQIFGNSGVGIMRGPGLVNFDFNLSKTFSISERQSFQLRGEFFNAFNHTNFGVPGVSLGAGFGQIVSANDGRIIQFALKYRF